MNTLHDAFIRALTDLGPVVATQIVSKKLARKGVRLSSAEKKGLTQHLIHPDAKPLKLRSASTRGRGPIQVAITPADLRRLEKQLTKIHESIPSLIDSLSDDIAPKVLRSLKRRWPAENRRRRRDSTGFASRLSRRWSKPLGMLSLLLVIAREFGEDLNDTLRSAGESDHRYSVEVLTRLHARACQVTAEIHVLLSSGFADGAMARWRSLYEIAVTALFVQEHGEDVAERYLLYSEVESWRAAQQYQEHCARLGYEPLTTPDLLRLQKQCQAQVGRFGSAYGERYGWAAGALHKRMPTFADIERAVKLQHVRPFYKMASYNVHPDPRALFFRLGLLDGTNVLLAGPSKFGLADPGQNAAESLPLVCAALNQLHPTLDSLVMLKVMWALAKETGGAFVQVQESFERRSAGAERPAGLV